MLKSWPTSRTQTARHVEARARALRDEVIRGDGPLGITEVDEVAELLVLVEDEVGPDPHVGGHRRIAVGGKEAHGGSEGTRVSFRL